VLKRLLIIAVLGCLGFSSGCLMMEVGVTNPIPEMRRVAIIPFINLSDERAVDGRRFAEMYFSELQKTPGFQVLPVGIVDSAIHDMGLNLNNPAEIPKLAEMLDVDAVVIGAVTEFSPYYPPRLGLQVSWYVTKTQQFVPGIPIDPHLRDAQDAQRKAESKAQRTTFFRGQSPEDVPMPPDPGDIEAPQLPPSYPFSPNMNEDQDPYGDPGMSPPSMPPPMSPPMSPQYQMLPNPPLAGGHELNLNGAQNCENPVDVEADSNKKPEPIMSYTRIFDGTDSRLVANLRDYVELNGDQRSGGWEGYLQRSDDFVRYCMNRMIVEMLQLHGGETHRRVVIAKRRFK
jgi:hypothetical protein